MEIGALIREKVQGTVIFKGETYGEISQAALRQVAAYGSISIKEAEIAALEAGVIPARYNRNLGTVGGPRGQLQLLCSCVAVIGLGGLGGLAAELLARMGVGRLVLVDGDCFSESNLNRQIISTEANLGAPKASAAATRIGAVNSAVEAVFYDRFATSQNLADMLGGCDLALDCLDSLSARFLLQDSCFALNIPFVHGAIAQFYGQVAVIYPGEAGLEAVYGSRDGEKDRGIEKELGNPATTPALVASLQVQEAIKILLNTGELLRCRLLFIDTLQCCFETVQLGKGAGCCD